MTASLVFVCIACVHRTIRTQLTCKPKKKKGQRRHLRPRYILQIDYWYSSTCTLAVCSIIRLEIQRVLYLYSPAVLLGTNVYYTDYLCICIGCCTALTWKHYHIALI